MSRRSLAFFAAKLLVAGWLLVWLFGSGRLDFSAMGAMGRPRYLVPAAVMLLISRMLPVWRWIGLLRVQQLEIRWPRAVRMTWLGYFASLFLPGAAGGDLAKACAACCYRPRDKTRAVSTVLLDRVFGLHTLLFLGSMGGVVILLGECDARQAAAALSPVFLLGILTAGLFLVFWRPTSGFALRLLPSRLRSALAASLTLYRSSWRQMCRLWLFSALCSLSAIGAFFLAAAAFGGGVSLVQMLTIVPLVMLSNVLPISPGGLGVGETAASELFGIFGLATGAVIVLTVRLIGICVSIPGAIALVLPGAQERVPESVTTARPETEATSHPGCPLPRSIDAVVSQQ